MLSLQLTDPEMKTLFNILKIFKRREQETVPIYYPNPKYLKNNAGGIPILVKVEKNLFSGKYKNRHWTFIRDVNEAFDFIKSQHTKNAKAHQIVCEVKQMKACLI